MLTNQTDEFLSVLHKGGENKTEQGCNKLIKSNTRPKIHQRG